MPTKRCAHLVALVTCAVTLLAATSAGAAVTSVSFEMPELDDGSPISNEYTGLRFLPVGGSTRPRVDVQPALARVSGERILDVSYFPFEFPVGQFNAQLTAGPANTVSLYTRSQCCTVGMRLRAYDSADQLVLSDPPSGYRSVAPSGWTLFQVQAAPGAFPINRIEMDTAVENSSRVWIDDVSYTTSDGPGTPDFALGLGPIATSVTVLPGHTVDVPIEIDRLGGSAGPITMSASGLPPGVSATFIPNPAGGTATVLRLLASVGADDAPPTPIGVSGAPANAAVGSGARVLQPSISVQVRDRFEIPSGPEPAAFAVAPCGTGVSRFTVTRRPGDTAPLDLDVTSTEDIEATTIPTQLEGEGPFFVELRLRRLDATPAPRESTAVVRARSGSAFTNLASVKLERIPASALFGSVQTEPFALETAIRARVSGVGLCAGSKIKVLATNETFETTYSQEPGRDVLTATTFGMRAQVDSKIEVLQAGDATPLVVDASRAAGYRDNNQFPFTNSLPRNAIGFAGWAELLSYGDVYVNILGADVVRPDFALLQYSWAEPVLAAGKGLCMGFSMMMRKLQGFGNQARYLPQAGAAIVPRLIPLRELPDSQPIRSQVFSGEDAEAFATQYPLARYINIQHGTNWTSEYIGDYLNELFYVGPIPDGAPAALENARASSARARTLQRVRKALGERRYPIVYLSPVNKPGAHAGIAYDLVEEPDGDFLIYVADPNVPWVPGSDDVNSVEHAASVERSTITVKPDGSWTYTGSFRTSPWSGRLGVDGNITVHMFERNLDGDLDPVVYGALTSVIPGEGAAASAGSATTSAADEVKLPALSEFRPPDAQDDAPPILVGEAGITAKVDLKSSDRGNVRTYLLSHGGGTVVEARTAPNATTRAVMAKDRINVGLQPTAPLRNATLSAADHSGTDVRMAEVTAGKLGGDVEFGFDRSGKTVSLSGTGRVRLALTATTKDGISSFAGPAMDIRRGETVSVTPRWVALSTGTVTAVVRRGGQTRRLRLRNTLPVPRLRVVAAIASRKAGVVSVRATVQAAGRLTAAKLVLRAATRQGTKVLGTTTASRSARRPGRYVITTKVANSGAARAVRIEVGLISGPPSRLASTRRTVNRALR